MSRRKRCSSLIPSIAGSSDSSNISGRRETIFERSVIVCFLARSPLLPASISAAVVVAILAASARETASPAGRAALLGPGSGALAAGLYTRAAARWAAALLRARRQRCWRSRPAGGRQEIPPAGPWAENLLYIVAD